MTFSVIIGPCEICGDGADYKVGAMTCKACGFEFEKLCTKCSTNPCPKCKGPLDRSENLFPKSLFRVVSQGDIEGFWYIYRDLSGPASDLNRLLDRNGNTLLHVACGIEKNKLAAAMCDALFQTGLSPTLKDKNGRTALTEMVRTRQYKPDVATMLQISVNEQDGYGVTALMFAAKGGGLFGSRRGNLTVVRHLLELGADLFLCDDPGRTALGYAIRSNDKGTNEAMIEFLEREMLAQTALDEFKKHNQYDFDNKGVLSFSPTPKRK
ncbi:hypothetical protein GCM10010909_29480 [Acidocella aquatica]|uniref:Ankyrin repeat protein n=1 Tax=Acidocella aquatica TaxID=1922313 RepID=A0ABQ6A951_9PROT|nr:hypothetical protein [Acidocella aquatica]GLR68267.1 hypothetical protein GCM10010909_29480 [Acidocella aquatica]